MVRTIKNTKAIFVQKEGEGCQEYGEAKTIFEEGKSAGIKFDQREREFH